MSTAHPYATPTGETVIADFIQPKQGMSMEMRVLLDQLDTEACETAWPPQYYDPTYVRDGDSYAVLAGPYGGYHKGRVWSAWVTPPASGHLKVSFSADDVNWAPDGAGCVTCCGPWSYRGVAVREYEFRRYQSGASAMFTPLRFPGQYYDPETDLHENWNRYYDPSTGRYLQSDPALQEPPTPSRDGSYELSNLVRSARELASPAYAYAHGNPLFFADPEGLRDHFVNCPAAPADSKGRHRVWFSTTASAEWRERVQ